MTENMKKLEYVGNGSYVIGVPTSAIVVDEQEAKRLITTGLYAEEKAASRQPVVVEKGDDK
ncbi:hypothetical protein UFOVP1336_34 [uncultured Caudovirales phage]|uniref:Uncharacterized protein n=1 Tax=uncultured Caudovirales phage TaxID=2100421 RepID=A0A6J5RQ94_9CAUD|nr:hypothetical protein UFOVP1336_34 [uncultured Caudovirales phage]